LLKKISFIGFKGGFNNFSFGMLFSVIFHGTIFFATIFALPFVVKKPLELMPIVSVELIQISEKTNIPYAPKAAKIIEKAKNENKKLLSEQAPPKEVKKEENNWLVKTSGGNSFLTPNVIIAGGVGSFEPRKFSPKECEKFENKSLFYSVKDKNIFKGKTVSIFGGGDSALDWAIELSKDSNVNLIHRRDEFRGAQATVDKMHALVKDGKINLFTKYQMANVHGEQTLESIDIKHDNDEIKNLKTEYVLGFFGLIMQLGPIANWGLNLNKKTIEVDTEKFETNQKGIYAVGDICNYPGKLKLILSGFHEGALAARACFKLARPDEKYRFEFTTTSTNLLKRLGKKE